MESEAAAHFERRPTFLGFGPDISPTIDQALAFCAFDGRDYPGRRKAALAAAAIQKLAPSLLPSGLLRGNTPRNDIKQPAHRLKNRSFCLQARYA